MDYWTRDADGKLILGQNPFYPSCRNPVICGDSWEQDPFLPQIMQGKYIQGTKIA